MTVTKTHDPYRRLLKETRESADYFVFDELVHVAQSRKGNEGWKSGDVKAYLDIEFALWFLIRCPSDLYYVAVVEHPEVLDAPTRNVGLGRSKDGRHDPMLIPIVEHAQNLKEARFGPIRSVVRLKAFDYVNSFGGHPFEGTRRSLLESGTRGGYEKTRVGRISSVDSGQPVGQVVERRTQVVGDVTRNHPPSGRRVSIDSEIRSVFSRLRVAVLPSEIWLSSDELLESPVESVEVYPCSIYLETTVIEWMHERIEPPDRPALQSRIGSNAP